MFSTKKFYRSSIRNKLLVVLPLTTALSLLLPFSVCLVFLRQQVVEHLGAGSALITNQVGHLMFVQTVTVIVVSVAAVLLLVGMVLLMSFSIANPITKLASHAEAMASGKKPLKPIHFEKGQDEVGQLAKTINHLVAQVVRWEEEAQKRRRPRRLWESWPRMWRMI